MIAKLFEHFQYQVDGLLNFALENLDIKYSEDTIFLNGLQKNYYKSINQFLLAKSGVLNITEEISKPKIYDINIDYIIIHLIEYY